MRWFVRLLKCLASHQSMVEPMNLALGQFLSDSSRLENEMFRLAILISHEDEEYLFAQYFSMTFGPKVKWFKNQCGIGKFDVTQKAMLEKAYGMLDDLIPNRNYIVHGETWHSQQMRAVYRIGITRENLNANYLQEFAKSKSGKNIFSVAQVEALSRQCLVIRAEILDVIEQQQEKIII